MKAAFWIVSEDYISEAIGSAETVAAHMPQLERVLFTDSIAHAQSLVRYPFHRIVQLPQREHEFWYTDFLRYMAWSMGHLPKEILYLDSDVYLVAPVPELFEVLRSFDIGMALAPGRRTALTVQEIPNCYSEYNIGVQVMSNNPTVRGLWEKAHRSAKAFSKTYGNNDQSPLREVLWNGYPIRVATITPEYNCRFHFGVQVADPVKILHGKLGPQDPQVLANKINTAPGWATDMGARMRIWKPTYQNSLSS